MAYIFDQDGNKLSFWELEEDSNKDIIVNSIADRLFQLAEHRTYSQQKVEDSVEKYIFPVGILLSRGDRGGEGENIYNQVRKSLIYWDKDSKNSFDLIFPGWSKEGEDVVFNTQEFIDFKNLIEKISKFTYLGETDLMLLNFIYEPGRKTEGPVGGLDFTQVILLPIEKLLKNNVIRSIDGLMGEIISVARKYEGDPDAGIWEISDELGLSRSRENFWTALKAVFLNKFSKVITDAEPFLVLNLERKS